MNFHNQLKGHVKSINQNAENKPFYTKSAYYFQIICLKNNKTTLYMSWPLTSYHSSKLPVFGTLIILLHTAIIKEKTW